MVVEQYLKSSLAYREIQTIFYVNKKSIVCYFKHNTNRMYQFPEFCNEEKLKIMLIIILMYIHKKQSEAELLLKDVKK